MNQFIKVAKIEARKSNMDQKHGCVIVHKGKVIAKGYNHHIDYYNHLWSIHAEIDAIRKLKKLNINYFECDMYVIRLSPKGELKLSKPCENCMKTITEYRIRNIYYSIHKDDEIISTYKKTRSKIA